MFTMRRLLCLSGLHQWGPWKRTGHWLAKGLDAQQSKCSRPGCHGTRYRWHKPATTEKGAK